MEKMEQKGLKPTLRDMLGENPLPADLRRLPLEQLPAVCDALRTRIIETLSHNPGHFASSMGAVELTVALHYVFHTPEDNIVWDVGHQAYAHKLLTGRASRFDTLRKKDGLSGFPNPKESKYDTFMAGHASNSISAALGMAVADSLTPGRENRKTVAVIGDASISGGLAFEGLNNASQHANNLLIVLNDNDMSIDPNVGAMHRYLSKLTTSARYNRFRYRAYNFFKRHGFISESGRGLLLRFTNAVKSLVSKRQNIFEGLNIRYFGPRDGHDVISLVKVLREIRDMQGPRLLHICTQKGKGFAASEADPGTWHAPGKFDPTSGKRLSSPSTLRKWQDVFGDTLVELADADARVVGITAAMPSGTSISKMMAKYPDRVFDVGISEGHAVTFAGGLAAAGMRPFAAIYSSFLQRGYDNIIHDVAIQGLPVTLCLDRAGVVGDDGVTHHGLFDLAYLSVIPGLKIAAPMDVATLRSLMLYALEMESPMAIRYPRGTAPDSEELPPFDKIEVGKARVLRRGSNIAVLSLGAVGHDVVKALERLEKEGHRLTHCDMVWLFPIDEKVLHEAAAGHKTIVTVEDASVHGGLGSTVTEWMARNHPGVKVVKLGVPEQEWVHHASVDQLKEQCGYGPQAIYETLLGLLGQSDGAENNSKS